MAKPWDRIPNSIFASLAVRAPHYFAINDFVNPYLELFRFSGSIYLFTFG